MTIIYDKATLTFCLQNARSTYVMKVNEEGYLMHLYWGKKIHHVNPDHLITFKQRSSFSPNPEPTNTKLTLDDLPQEYPAYGTSDFRVPAYQVQLENGSTITDLRYESYQIIQGKPKLEGLPATYVEDESEAQTLEITMRDTLINLKVILSYTIYRDHEAITRNVRFVNEGKQSLKLLSALSMNVDFRVDKFEVLHLHGAWAKERQVERLPLHHGIWSIDSKRGSSSHNHNPFVALVSKNTTEDYGDAYGVSLVYSGNFLAQVEVDQYQNTRISMGINPFDFTWLLEPGEVFETPECVLVYSANGIGEMSRTYHKLYRQRLCRGKYRDAVRPVLVNNWEATYFDFTHDKIVDIATVGKELGIELFVLDDGWFGKRDSDNCSLGDWVVDKKKLPNGLEALCEAINDIGMQFGLWFEPEMVSPDSDLYREHPDWCLHVPNRTRSEARMQLVLDLSREDVCDYIIEAISSVLRSTNISYVKWDMNRNMTEIGSALLGHDRQRETAHRYMLGLYRVMETITSNFPDVLFESCSGGGGRFDPGMLYYMPQTWTSDNTDAIERLKIQYGTSMVYPISSMGAHVSAVPNHQVHRMTSLKMRGDVAMSGNFGYELDLCQMTMEEREEVKKQVVQYKEVRELIQFGQVYRLSSPFENNHTAWMVVSEDQSELFVGYFRVLATPNGYRERVKLAGLDASREYRIEETGECYSGEELMHFGLIVPELEGDYQSVIWTLKS